MSTRNADIHRKTGETDVRVFIALDGTGVSQIDTGIGFFDHMLTLFASHGLFDLTVKCRYCDGAGISRRTWRKVRYCKVWIVLSAHG